MTEFPLTHLDRRPRKRPRLGWDVVPETPFQTQVAPKVLDLFSIFSELLNFFFEFVFVL